MAQRADAAAAESLKSQAQALVGAVAVFELARCGSATPCCRGCAEPRRRRAPRPGPFGIGVTWAERDAAGRESMSRWMRKVQFGI